MKVQDLEKIILQIAVSLQGLGHMFKVLIGSGGGGVKVEALGLKWLFLSLKQYITCDLMSSHLMCR